MRDNDSHLPTETFAYTVKFRGRDLPKSLRFVHMVRAVLLLPILLLEWKALVGLQKSRKKHAITLMNDISNSTQGRGLEVMNKFICIIRNLLVVNVRQTPDLLITPAGDPMELQSVNVIVDELRQVGFSRLPKFMDPLVARRICTDVLRLPGRSTKPAFDYQTQDEWRHDSGSGPRYTVNTQSIERLGVCQEIANNEVIREVANQYLGCPALLATTQVWTTRPPNSSSSEVLSEAAMAFHCDSDYFGFLKFFVLLTNVDAENGPFTFVGGSHRGKRHVAGRMKDSEIVSDDDVVYYGTGQAGDLFIVDSKGWHKASQPQSGYRTMLQIVYSSSLFGSPT